MMTKHKMKKSLAKNFQNQFQPTNTFARPSGLQCKQLTKSQTKITYAAANVKATVQTF